MKFFKKTDGIESSILEKIRERRRTNWRRRSFFKFSVGKGSKKYTIETQNNEKIFLDATELNEQYKNRNTILEEEQKSLKDIHEEKNWRLKSSN